MSVYVIENIINHQESASLLVAHITLLVNQKSNMSNQYHIID